MKKDGKIAINRRIISYSCMNNKEPFHSERDLRHFIRMRMVHKGSILLEGKFILECFAWLNRFLIKTCNAIHSIRQNDAMPVNRCRLIKLIGDVNPYSFPFYC